MTSRPNFIERSRQPQGWLLSALFAVCLFVWSGPTPAQETSPTLPGAILMPWVLWGLDDEQAAQISPLLAAAEQNLAQLYMKNPSTLTAFAQANTKSELTLNARQISDRIMVGSLKQEADGGSVTIQPLLCPISDRYVLAIELIDTARDIILSASHTTFTRQRWLEVSRDRALFTQTCKDMAASQLEAALHGLRPPNDKSAMHLSLSLGRESGRVDQGSYLCLNMLLAHQLAQTYLVNHEIGNNESYHMRRLLAVTGHAQRASRRLVVVWTMEDYSSFPLKINQTIRISESILGGRIGAPLTYPFILDGGEPLVMPVAPELDAFLQGEALALGSNEPPQVAKIYRAWAYLDKGRAYGLKMNDRLYMQKNGQTIKGHVVGFYGPGLGIKSPRGFAVHEGAIVFIRKGQGDTRIGDELLYDPTAFPTAWPPTATPP